MFSRESLMLFNELIGQLQIPASHPQLEALATQVARARAELNEALLASVEAVPAADQPQA